MARAIALLLSAVIVAGAARADGLPPPPPPLDVSGWYLRGNIDDDDAQQSPEGRTYLQPNLLADQTNGPAGPARYSMREMR